MMEIKILKLSFFVVLMLKLKYLIKGFCNFFYGIAIDFIQNKDIKKNVQYLELL